MVVEVDLNNGEVNLFETYNGGTFKFKEIDKVLKLLEEIFNRIESHEALDLRLDKVSEYSITTVGEW